MPFFKVSKILCPFFQLYREPNLISSHQNQLHHTQKQWYPPCSILQDDANCCLLFLQVIHQAEMVSSGNLGFLVQPSLFIYIEFFINCRKNRSIFSTCWSHLHFQIHHRPEKNTFNVSYKYLIEIITSVVQRLLQ